FPNAAVGGPGFSAIIKFYSARDAHRAQKACDQKQLFHTSPVKVHLGTRHKAVQHNTLALKSSRCQELANYYFGFQRENTDIVTPLQKQSLKFFCALEVVLPSHECRSPWVGMAEEPLDKLEEGLFSSMCVVGEVTQKLAIQKAMTDAFQKLLNVVLESGKTAVAYRPCEEVTYARTEEELQDLIQVTYFSCQPCGQREQECLSDCSFEEEEFRLPELD
ncbi:hypothetical protein EI555_000923, partial [Monodon monoceros]